MDELKQYILMCEKAEKIQKSWKPSPWDRMYCVKLKKVVILSGYCTDEGVYGHGYDKYSKDNIGGQVDPFDADECCENGKDGHIWLPREDDLWEMLSATHTLGAKISMFHEFYDPEFYCPGEDNSLETSPCKKCAELGKHRRTTFTTIKQFLLAFVMDELYKKRWNGKEWVK